MHRALEAMHRDAEWAGDARAWGTSAAVLVGDLLLNWAVPIAVIWGAIWFTGTYPDRVNRTADAAAPSRSNS